MQAGPVEGDKVIIEKDNQIVRGVTPPALNSLTIEGKLSFANTKDVELTTEWIMLHGELEIGTSVSTRAWFLIEALSGNIEAMFRKLVCGSTVLFFLTAAGCGMGEVEPPRELARFVGVWRAQRTNAADVTIAWTNGKLGINGDFYALDGKPQPIRLGGKQVESTFQVRWTEHDLDDNMKEFAVGEKMRLPALEIKHRLPNDKVDFMVETWRFLLNSSDDLTRFVESPETPEANFEVEYSRVR